MNTDIHQLNEEQINDLATDWYFLSLQTKAAGHYPDDQIINELIEIGLKLKAILAQENYTVSQPLNVYVDEDTCLDVWLDGEGKMATGTLYSNNA
jgi:hypothetical protein